MSTTRFSALGRRAQAPQITRLMSMALETPGLLSLAAGFTDTNTLPVAAVRAAADVLDGTGAPPEHLQYGTNAGRPGLRAALAARLAAQDGAGADAAALTAASFITNGSQQALYLAMQVLCEPGDIVLVDRPSYFVFLELLAGLGVQARSMPTTEAGTVDAPALRSLLDGMKASGERDRLKAVYFISYFSNPSGRSLSAADKTLIADTLAAVDCVVPAIEDAAYRELWFDRPHDAPSILALPAWDAFPKLYLTTLTKPFASGLKVGGGVCTDPAWLASMLHVKGHQDFGSANFNQAICEQVLINGEFDRHLSALRPAYAEKMRTLHAALTEGGLADLGWSWGEPAGGLYLWLRGPENVDTGFDGAFCKAALGAGVLYVPGALCFGDRAPRNRVRLSYGVLGGEPLREAGRRFVQAARVA